MRALRKRCINVSKTTRFNTKQILSNAFAGRCWGVALSPDGRRDSFRIQFAFTIAFHYIYPPLSIGLGLVMVFMEAQYLRTGNVIYEKMTRFWLRIFALIFGIGVATGIVMEFEFGTNWAVYCTVRRRCVRQRARRRRHLRVCIGVGLPGHPHLRLESRRPAGALLLHDHGYAGLDVLGYMDRGGQLVAANTHGLSYRRRRTEGARRDHRLLGHGVQPVFCRTYFTRVLGSFLAGAFLVMSVSAWYLLKGKYIELSRSSFSIALGVGVVSALLQLVAGHRSADVVAHYQPAKLAAMEGHFDSMKPADLYLFGWVDKKNQTTTGIAIPGGLSLFVHGSTDAPIRGLNSFPEKDRPGAVNFVFQTYHIMIAIGMFLIALTLYSVYLWWRGTLFRKTLADVDLRVGRIPAADCQPGGLVYGRGWTATLGGL